MDDSTNQVARTDHHDQRMTPVVVNGAGLGRLSAARYLTGRGYDVAVIEREDGPVGRTGIVHR